MKKIILLCSCIATLAFAACSTKSTQESEAVNAVEVQQATESVVAVAPIATDGKPIELSDASLIAPGVNVEQLTVIDFNAVWCGPCRQLTPVIEELAAKYQGKVTFITVDIDKYHELFEAYNVGSSIPAVVFLTPDGQRADYIGTGELLPASAFESIIAKYLK